MSRNASGRSRGGSAYRQDPVAYYKEELRKADKQIEDLQQLCDTLQEEHIALGEDKKGLERTIRKLKGQQQRGTIPLTTDAADEGAHASGRDLSQKKRDGKSNEPVNVAITDLQKINGFHEPTRRELHELKDMIAKLTPAIEQPAKRHTASRGWGIFGGSCSACTDLQSKLDRLEEENSKLVTQMNEGDLGQSKETIAKQYMSFFSQEADSQRRRSMRYYEKTEDKVKLCATFKRVHDMVQNEIVRHLQAAIQELFQPGATSHKRLSDLSRAYTRLLVSEKLTKDCPMEWSQKISTTELKKGSSSLTIQNAIVLSWKLVTAVPPMIATTDCIIFDERIHEQIAGGSDVNIPKGGAVRYVRPVLYGSCKGDVTVNGLVT